MRALLLGALLALLILPGARAQAQDREFDIDIFYEELAPYGDWYEHPRWGLVWEPNVDDEWRPYSLGYWTFTDDYGWYWVSDEPFGWAVFHYGRWVLDEDDGWLWIPDTEWGPAWVIWRWSDDYVGWTALGPGSSWGPDGDLDYDFTFYESPGYILAWSFVAPRYLTTRDLFRRLAPRTRHSFLLRRTKHVRGHRKHDKRIVNTGIDVRRFERLIGRPVARTKLKSVDNPRALRARREPGGASDVPVFMPRIITRPDGPKRPPQLKARPERKDRGPSVTGFPKDKSGETPGTKEPAAPAPRIIPSQPGDQKQRFKQTTTPPPTKDTGPPADLQRRRSKDTTAPPPTDGKAAPADVPRQRFKQTITPPATGTPRVEPRRLPQPQGPSASDRQRASPPATGSSTGRTQRATEKDRDKDGKKAEEPR
jgi:hypothetical protein